jgi:hypothetical protein
MKFEDTLTLKYYLAYLELKSNLSPIFYLASLGPDSELGGYKTMAYRSNFSHCQFLYIKLYWNTTIFTYVLSMIAFITQWQS